MNTITISIPDWFLIAMFILMLVRIPTDIYKTHLKREIKRLRSEREDKP